MYNWICFICDCMRSYPSSYVCREVTENTLKWCAPTASQPYYSTTRTEQVRSGHITFSIGPLATESCLCRRQFITLLAEFGSAPLSSRRATTSWWPFKAALDSGVTPSYETETNTHSHHRKKIQTDRQWWVMVIAAANIHGHYSARNIPNNNPIQRTVQ